MTEKKTMELWDAVFKTDPKYTKRANVRGNQITAIAPQYQIMCATKQWGSYGTAWGWKEFSFDYTLVEKTGIVVFKGVFYYPGGAFPISSSISVYKDGAHTKPDADFAKKVETDTTTKALSKLGFNGDVFMGSFDDVKYVEKRAAEVQKEEDKENGVIDLKPTKEGYHELAIIINPERVGTPEQLKELIIDEIILAKADPDREARDVYKASTYAAPKGCQQVGAIKLLKDMSPEVYDEMTRAVGLLFKSGDEQ